MTLKFGFLDKINTERSLLFQIQESFKQDEQKYDTKMVRKILYWALLGLVLLVFDAAPLKGQGCSDAGFCTMGAMKPDQSFNKKIELKLRSIELSYYYGESTLSPIINAFFCSTVLSTVFSRLPFAVFSTFVVVEFNFPAALEAVDLASCFVLIITSSVDFFAVFTAF